jgi:uncharacterized protein
MSMNLGINVVEVDGKATPSIQGAATSVAGFVVRSRRGLPGVVRQVTSFSQFVQHFGGYIPSAVSAYAVRGFFDNGGSLAQVTRIVNPAVATPATRGFTATVAAITSVVDVEGAIGLITTEEHGLSDDDAITIEGTSSLASSTVWLVDVTGPHGLTLKTSVYDGPYTGTGTITQKLQLSAAYRGTADPGSWGLSLSVKITATPGASTYFDLTVALDNVVVETWEKLTAAPGDARNVTSLLNDEFSGSKYIKVVSTGKKNPSPTPLTAQMPPQHTFVAFNTGGVDDAPDISALRTAVAAAFPLFDLPSTAVQLLAFPESDDAAIVQSGLDYCEARGDRFFIGHTLKGADDAAATGYGAGLQRAKAYGAIYFPNIRVNDPIGASPRWIPPTGHVMGVYARTDQERGIWKAPAGEAALIRGALDVEFQLDDTQHTTLVKNGSVNAIRFLPGTGIVIDSSRTLSTNQLWLYVNVRLLFNYVKSSLKEGLRWVKQEPNDVTLWNKIKYNTVTPFLLGLWRRGAFGPGAAKDVFTVKVDSENNTSDDVKNGLLKVDVYFFPSRPAETIIISVGQQEGSSSASEG